MEASITSIFRGCVNRPPPVVATKRPVGRPLQDQFTCRPEPRVYKSGLKSRTPLAQVTSIYIKRSSNYVPLIFLSLTNIIITLLEEVR